MSDSRNEFSGPVQRDAGAAKPKLLVLELWGIGDLTMATALLSRAVEHFEVVVLGKPHASALLGPSFPQLRFVIFDAPWTVFEGKYRVWKWNWPELKRIVRSLRAERFTHAVSVRRDPRDHLLMWLIGASRRHGFPAKGSALFLTDAVDGSGMQHRVDGWRAIGRSLGLQGAETADPRLAADAYGTGAARDARLSDDRPIVCLHTGSRIAVRRWPEEYFRDIIGRLRQQFEFHLVLIPDPDGYGAALADVADTFLPQIPLAQLVATVAGSDLVLCNDSAPSHIAAACRRPVISVFGPTEPAWFRPWGGDQKVVIRDICPYRPCFDYCRFPEPYCLTKLTPEIVWPEIGDAVQRLLAAHSR